MKEKMNVFFLFLFLLLSVKTKMNIIKAEPPERVGTWGILSNFWIELIILTLLPLSHLDRANKYC